MKIITIANQKGGTGKTTTTLALASYLADKGKRVLTIDLDTQGNLTDTQNLLVIPEGETFDPRANIYQVINGKVDIRNALLTAKEQFPFTPLWKGVASSIDTAALNKRQTYIPFKEILSPIERNYDYAILDTPPSLSIVTISALQSADYVIVPALADRYSETAIRQLHEIIKDTKAKLVCLIVNKWNKRSIINQECYKTIEALAKQYKTKVFTVREGVAIREAQYSGEPNIFKYDSKSVAALDYKEVFDAIAKDI